MKNHFLLILLLFSIHFNFCTQNFPLSSITRNKCKLTISQNKHLTQDSPSFIFSNNKLDPSYEKSSPIHHQSPPSNDVDFLYTNETLFNPSSHSNLSITIHSQNPSLTNPKVNLNVLDTNIKSIRTTEIELIYNCNPSSSGYSLITLTIKAFYCNEIQLTWEKHCNGNQLTHLPRINLGFAPGIHNIINHGVLLSFHRNMIDKQYANKNSNHYLINGNILHLFISSGETNKTLNVSTMTISNQNSYINKDHNYNSEYISSIIAGDITKGGILEPNEDKEFYVFFECKYKEAKVDYGTDMQLDIPFEDNKIISLYFTKVCKVNKSWIGVWMFKLLYWCAIMSVFMFIGVVVYFHYNQGNINNNVIKELVNQTKGNINSFMKGTIDNVNGYVSTYHNRNEEVMEDDDENEGLNIKITSGKITNNQNEDYGESNFSSTQDSSKNHNESSCSSYDPFYLPKTNDQFNQFMIQKSRVLSNMDFLELNSIITDDINEILCNAIKQPKYTKKKHDEKKFLKLNSNCFLVSSLSESGNNANND